MIGGLGIIRGQGSGGSQTKVAPFWTDRYPSEIGDEMTVCQAPPGVLPPDRLFVVIAVPEVMARLRELTKEA